jgi:hypothetical protein
VQEATFKRDEAEKASSDQQTLFLDETDGWTSKYKRGSLKRKRVAIFAQMEGFESASSRRDAAVAPGCLRKIAISVLKSGR